MLRGRVCGMLAVSRSFGDHGLKDYVSARPYTNETMLSEEDIFVIVACDGLWDVVEDQEAVDFVRKRIDERRVSGTARALVQQALSRGSTDNVSVLVVFF